MKKLLNKYFKDTSGMVDPITAIGLSLILIVSAIGSVGSGMVYSEQHEDGSYSLHVNEEVIANPSQDYTTNNE